jgi:chloramphenicol O-acetyltransferase type A
VIVPRRLDLSGWRRREHFLFFKEFEQPFFNVCSELDVTALVSTAADAGRSFFLSALYLSLRAANEIEELRMRIHGADVVLHPVIHGGSTVLREDETFGFGYFDYGGDFDLFESQGKAVLARARRSRALRPSRERDDLIYYSVLPWISFTSFSHARRSPATDSIPRIVFGKRSKDRDGAWKMAVSIEVHHALVDGLHVGRFLDRFQELLRDPAPVLIGPPRR